MRKIFLLLAMMGTVWAVDVKETKTSPVKTYTTFNERVADIAGAPYEPFYNNSILPVSGHLQVPATFKGQMLGSSKFTSANNSSTDTLEFLGDGWKFSDGCFGDSLVVICPKISDVNPDFFCVGDGVTDDTKNFQRAVNTGCKKIVGTPGHKYKIDCNRLRWTPYDLHNIAKYGDNIVYDSGYYYGVNIPDSVEISDCDFRIYTSSASTQIYGFAFAVGSANSLTRTTNQKFSNCKFSFASGAADKLTNCILAQSVDNFVFENNTIDGTLGTRWRMILGYWFDCNNVKILNNSYTKTLLSFVGEFSNNIDFSHNEMINCRYCVDLDKRCSDVRIIGNSYDRPVMDTVDDAPFELNGTQNAILSGNTVNNAVRYLILTVKNDIYNTWTGVITNPVIVNDTVKTDSARSTSVWENITSNDIVSNIYKQALWVGDRWDKVPHPTKDCGSGLYVTTQFINCYAQGNEADVEASTTGSAILIYEGRDLRLNVNVEGSGGCGVSAVGYSESDYTGAGDSSGIDVTVSGKITGCRDYGFYASNANKVNLTNLIIENSGDSSGISCGIAYPEEKNCMVTATNLLIDAKDKTINNGLWVYSTNFLLDFKVRLTNCLFKGHASRDIYLNGDSISTKNFSLSNCFFKKPHTTYFNETMKRRNGNPNGAVTPGFIGDMLYDSDSTRFFIARDSVRTRWLHILTADTAGVFKMNTAKIGAAGSNFTGINIIDGAADTISFTSGGKTWKFLPVANQ